MAFVLPNSPMTFWVYDQPPQDTNRASIMATTKPAGGTFSAALLAGIFVCVPMKNRTRYLIFGTNGHILKQTAHLVYPRGAHREAREGGVR